MFLSSYSGYYKIVTSQVTFMYLPYSSSDFVIGDGLGRHVILDLDSSESKILGMRFQYLISTMRSL
jgi:hypothetical protein